MGTLIDLPDTAIDEILCRLPIEDAVRTSVLSRAWRHRWRSIPDLDFGNNWASVSADAVTGILSQHSVPIRLFRCDLSGGDPSAVRSWIDLLATRASSTLRVLDIQWINEADFQLRIRIQLGEILCCFPHLTRLRLRGRCFLLVPSDSDSSVPVPPSIIDLDLECMTSVDDKQRECDLSMYVPACPSLQTLHVSRPPGNSHRDRFPFDLCSIARHFPVLKHLEIYHGRLTGSTPHHAVFPSLLTLDLQDFDCDEGHWEFIPSCPLLETLLLQCINSFSLSLCDLHPLACKFPHLARLDLSCCRLRALPDSFRGFNHLRTLSFYQVTCCGQLSILISACPSLEELDLDCAFDQGEGLHVTCRNLQQLRIYCEASIDDLAITNAPVLREIYIESLGYVSSDTTASGHIACYKLMEFMKNIAAMPALEELRLNFTALQFFGTGYLPQRAPIGFNNLKALDLTANFGDVRQLSTTLYLLKGAVDLSRLILRFISSRHFIHREPIGEGFWATQEQVNLLGKLEMVEIHFMKRAENDELSLVKFVLAEAHVLRTMVITLYFLDDKGKVMAKILEFSTASDQARILFR